MDGDHLFSIEKTRTSKGEPVEIDISWPEDGDSSLILSQNSEEDPDIDDFVIL